ncbi:K channel inward rectifier conserved region 2 domain protein [Gluconacetobacter diazotrophicus PA1 5]|uniref:ATP-sensitive potassium channel protein n=2 Tax=Gluconacetobacter diazotrophicus TaxID=33996 RepID=A0A7W4FEJ9_GLUDI|nr:K channel inward rectifier conserved region 2 domain protein [Gluconacetobacter diazotrophicus PA1 5]MBB2156294.1 ATP-sensitive potassium channel protein [Gluconacetobacter diazotrophicus]TWA98314.1 inward rectifier potassium channel [Gluconacetobacter diazotrophicus]
MKRESGSSKSAGGHARRTPFAAQVPQALSRLLNHHALEDRGHDNIVRIGDADRAWSDLYHHALTVRWRTFFWSSLAFYVLINVGFALLYMMAPGQVTGTHPGAFWDYFFFSIQTLSTVGYGVMAPVGPVAHVISSFELLAGMILNAVATGLVFARFARPKARIMFSDRALIRVENGISHLSVRIANRRLSPILSVGVEMFLARLIVQPNGRLARQFDPLPLVQSHIPVLRFAFPLMHVIDEHSPLNGLTVDELRLEEAEIVVTMTGTDEVSGQSVFARNAYGFDRVLYNHRFVDIIDSGPDGRITVDYTRFHATEGH